MKGARQALVAACADHELFRELLYSGDDFDTRYLRLRGARLPTGRRPDFSVPQEGQTATSGV